MKLELAPLCSASLSSNYTLDLDFGLSRLQNAIPAVLKWWELHCKTRFVRSKAALLPHSSARDSAKSALFFRSTGPSHERGSNTLSNTPAQRFERTIRCNRLEWLSWQPNRQLKIVELGFELARQPAHNSPISERER